MVENYSFICNFSVVCVSNLCLLTIFFIKARNYLRWHVTGWSRSSQCFRKKSTISHMTLVYISFRLSTTRDNYRFRSPFYWSMTGNTTPVLSNSQFRLLLIIQLCKFTHLAMTRVATSLLLTLLLPTFLTMTSSTTCPHPKFVQKHVCLNCQNTVQDATRFAYLSAATRRHKTGQNLVFIAPAMTYTTVGQYCVFKFRAPKYNCLYRNNQWSCRYVKDVIARHDAKTGHYYYRLDT